MRAHRWLKLLVVASLIAFPASLPASATANSAFDQYVETPPDSGSNNSGNDNQSSVNPSNGKDEGSTSGGQNGSGTSSADPMVAWANGDASSENSPVSGKADSTSTGQNPVGSNSGSDAPLVEKNGFLSPGSSGGDGTPVLLLVAMVLAAVSLAGLTIFRKRRLD